MKKELDVCGGCNAKISAGDLDEILSTLPVHPRDDLLIGFDYKDDGAVIKVTEDEGMIVTMDFFPPMVADPYIFGKVAATNALSDIYAMGGEPVSAMNMVCFPEEEDPEILKLILQGGAEVVQEAGATLCGGHSIHDPKIKYGLSVTGKVNLKELWQNNTAKEGDLLILTKPLGISLLMTGYGVDEVKEEDFQLAVKTMLESNGPVAKILKKYHPHGVTDVTGFGLLGHTSEMVRDTFTAILYGDQIPILPGAQEAAREFVFTAGGHRNRKSLQGKVEFKGEDYAFEEVLYDPQTSGGLLIAISPENGKQFIKEVKEKGHQAYIIGKIGPSLGLPILVRGGTKNENH